MSIAHRQAHNGSFVICRCDGQQWPCRTVAAFIHDFEGLADGCRYLCPRCADFVWIQMQDGEMWCPNGSCGYYASQFELLGLICDPTLADVQSDILALSNKVIR